MKSALEDLKEFHRVFRAASAESPQIVSDETYRLRRELIREEVQELLDAMRDDNLVEIADGLADACYVIIGTAIAYGIPLDQVWEEVHRTNMAKSRECSHCKKRGQLYEKCPCRGTGRIVWYCEDGKILKPEGWTPPRIEAILREAYLENRDEQRKNAAGFGEASLKNEGCPQRREGDLC